MAKRTTTTLAAMAMLAAACGSMDPELGKQEHALRDSALRVTPFANASRAIAMVKLSPTTVRLPEGMRPAQPSIPTEPITDCKETATPSAVVQTSSAPIDAAAGSASWRYYLDETPRLHLAAKVRSVCGAHVGYFDLFAPDGSFYQRIGVPFVASGEGRRARKVDGGYLIEVELPVSGTDIEKVPLTGTWSVNFLLDDDNLALGIGLFHLYR